MVVELYQSPWPGGLRARWHGPVKTTLFLADGFDEDELCEGIDELLLRLAREASVMDANSVVGFCVEINPFYEADGRSGLGMSAEGTAATLSEPW